MAREGGVSPVRGRRRHQPREPRQAQATLHLGRERGTSGHGRWRLRLQPAAQAAIAARRTAMKITETPAYRNAWRRGERDGLAGLGRLEKVIGEAANQGYENGYRAGKRL